MAKVLFGMGVEGGIEDHLPEDLARGVEVGNGATPSSAEDGFLAFAARSQGRS
jgi:hypothetical protein